MDPLSITTGVIAVSTLATQVVKILAQIRDDWESLPGRIHALNNEVQDFSIVLHQVAVAAKERSVSFWDSHGKSTVSTQLARGEAVLLDLKHTLERFSSAGVKKRDAISRSLLWRREQGQVAALQEDIKQVKSSLNVLLGATNSYVSRTHRAPCIPWPTYDATGET